ncbi:MAG: hypothetical protein ACPG2Y_00265 [Acholeplasmataceae bacterium]
MPRNIKHQFRLLKEINDYICQFGFAYGATPPRCFQLKVNRQERQYGANYNSICLIKNLIKYHVKFSQIHFDNVLSKFFLAHKTFIFKLFPIKQFQLNVQQTSQLQGILSMNNNQMRKMQRFVRQCTDRILLCNEALLLDFQCVHDLLTAVTLLFKFQVSSQYTNSRGQLIVQELSIYMVDIRDAISRLISSACNKGDFFIHQTLPQNRIQIELGCDKSDSGIAESVSAAVVPKSHGKFGSLLTTLTDKKVAENYYNYRAISLLNNKRMITNQLLKRPNIIILAMIYRNDMNTVLSKKFIVFPMVFETEEQERWDDKLKSELINCDPPPMSKLAVDISKLPVLPNPPIKIKPDESNSGDPSSDNEMNSNDNAQLAIQGNDKQEISDDDEVLLVSNDDNCDQKESADQQPNNANTRTDMIEALKHDSRLWMNEAHELDPGIRTMQFWSSKQMLIHFDRLYVVELPNGFQLKYPKDNTNRSHTVIEDELNDWIIKIVKGETRIVHNEKQAQLAESTAQNEEAHDSSDHASMSETDVNVITEKKTNRNDSAEEYIPDSAEEHSSDHVLPPPQRQRKKKKNQNKYTTEITIRHYPLHQFHFNAGSKLNRMDKAIWDQNSSCASTRSAQSDTLHFIEWSSLTQCKDNKKLPILGEHNPPKYTQLTMNIS